MNRSKVSILFFHLFRYECAFTSARKNNFTHESNCFNSMVAVSLFVSRKEQVQDERKTISKERVYAQTYGLLCAIRNRQTEESEWVNEVNESSVGFRHFTKSERRRSSKNIGVFFLMKRTIRSKPNAVVVNQCVNRNDVSFVLAESISPGSEKFVDAKSFSN